MRKCSRVHFTLGAFAMNVSVTELAYLVRAKRNGLDSKSDGIDDAKYCTCATQTCLGSIDDHGRSEDLF